MYTINQYVKAVSLEEAYELNQKKANLIFGGTLWLRLGNRTINTAIDLSALGLDKIEEREDAFVIGCMTSLRELELCQGLEALTRGAIRESLQHIVGTQFRNCATVGGSIFGRFGFSDILTCLLVLDTTVDLYKGGRVPLAEFVKMPRDNDILTHIIIKKTKRQAVYQAFRTAATDFPVLTCAVSRGEDGIRTAIGARPNKAVLFCDEENYLQGEISPAKLEAYAAYIQEHTSFGTNMRGSAAYRKALAGILVKRALQAALREENDL